MNSPLDEKSTELIGGVLYTKAGNGDVVCVAHGTAIDVHCCNCHSGFLFDVESCTCIFSENPEVECATDSTERSESSDEKS